ncbi:hypothetical protein JCM10908_001407 [Rhodotorula pacifica]|uniref:uncharacterized protein n=1 Tax=Rhodotorula pacifica TaxID=1495444 RepID=UPI0031716910
MVPSTSRSKPTSAADQEISPVHLLWTIQRVPASSTERLLPKLGSPDPWYILPSVLSDEPPPWGQESKEALEEYHPIHQRAKEAYMEVEAHNAAWAKSHTDPDEARRLKNRKKKERKERAKLRREAGGDDETETNGDSKKSTDTEEKKEEKEKWAYALPPGFDDAAYRGFLEIYANLHANTLQARQRHERTELGSHEHGPQRYGNAYLYPGSKESDNLMCAFSWDPKTRKQLYHFEV